MKRLSFALLVLCVLNAFGDVPRIILDTDVCGDYDDTGAMAVLFNLEAEGACRVLGIASSNAHEDAVPLIEVIARSFGRGDIPIVRPVSNERSAENWCRVKFGKVAARRFSHPRFAVTAEAPDALNFYRETLAAQPDGSVTICIVGWGSNLAALLDSAGGRDLAKRKVRRLVWMAGRERGGREYNFMMDVTASRRILRDFPRPIVFSPFEIGARVFTGTRLVAALGRDDPVRCCYGTVFAQDTGAEKRGRESWDQTAVWYAVHGDDALFTTKRGVMTAVGEDGTNAWKDDAGGSHACIEFAAPPEKAAETIESHMIRRPAQNAATDPRPFVWWHWSGTAVTIEGILRDLDAMLDAGIGGATIFQVTCGPCCEYLAEGYEDETNPGLTFGNDAWCDMVAFAAHEAKVRGLEIGMHNCPGYTVSGGPWITPEQAMKKLVWTSAPKGTVPPQPETQLGFYREIGRVDAEDKTYRFGYTCTGSQCMPVAKALWHKCLEADKMNARAINGHLDNVLRRPLGLDFILMDSYEAGPYDWTDDFREQFEARRGYDPLARLPAYVGGVSEGAAQIRADMARTIEELSTERHYWVFRDRLHAAGIRFVVEPYGGPFDACEAAYASDMPTTEFWGRRPFWVKPGMIGGDPQMGGAAGRAAGRTILAAEAFTAMPFDDPFTIAPRDLKACADASFARGINRMLLHHWVHQPFPASRKPGMGMGYWGTHFGENQTWYEPGKAFFRYLRDCQEFLQRGEEVVDVLSVEAPPVRGMCMDAIPRRVFLEGTELAGGAIRLRDSGRTYRHLLVPDALRALPAIARRIAACEKAGVKLVTASTMPPRPFEVVSGVPVTTEGPVLATARCEKDGTRLFFVANVSTNDVSFVAEFRATGIPEVRDIEQGRVYRGEVVAVGDGTTRVKLDMDPLSSIALTFVPATKIEPRKAKPPRLIATVTGPWQVTFERGRGAPTNVLARTTLASWTESADRGVRFFSGTAVYKTAFHSPEAGEATLELGDVRDMARVRLNGRDLGVAWHEPFRLSTRGALKDGENVMEIEVTNGWHNRLLGDCDERDDCAWGPLWHHRCALDGTKGLCGRGLKHIPDWAWKDVARPSPNRIAFSTWDYFPQGGKPVPSGLLGPVRVMK